jgi:nuclear GTP-binding protein
VRLREKIHKNAAAKQKKARRDAKKNPEWRSKLKKDPGIPTLIPNKDQILQEIEEKRRLKEEENARRRQLAKAQKLGVATEDDAIDDSGSELEDSELVDVDPDQEDSMHIVSLVAILTLIHY